MTAERDAAVVIDKTTSRTPAAGAAGVSRVALLILAAALLAAGVVALLLAPEVTGGGDAPMVPVAEAEVAADPPGAADTARETRSGSATREEAAAPDPGAAPDVRGDADSQAILAQRRERQRANGAPAFQPPRPAPARQQGRPVVRPAPRPRPAPEPRGAIATSSLLRVENQPARRTIEVAMATAPGSGGFLVVYADQGGAMGQELGRRYLTGASSGTSVRVDERLPAGGAVWIVLHHAHRPGPGAKREVGAPVVDDARAVRARILIEGNTK